MTKLPSNVKLITRIAAGFGIVQSCAWLVLGALALASYLRCSWSQADDAAGPLAASFTGLVQQYFFLNEYCPQARSLESWGGAGGSGGSAVSAYEMHVWAAAAVATSGVWLIASMCALFFVTDENVGNASAALYAWSVVAVLVSSADLALGIVLGLTYRTLTDLANGLDESSTTELLELSALRGGALALMLVALRGLVLLLLNLALAALMLHSACRVNAALNRLEHNIHSMGPLYAFQGSKTQADPWSTLGVEFDSQYDRFNGGQLNRGYSRSEHDNWQHLSAPQSSRRPQDDSYSRSFDRSDSWKANSAPLRPFSYLEEPQFSRPQPPKSPAPAPPAAPTPPWKRGVSAPPPEPGVPAPDYSPPPPPAHLRQPRLKSALKSTAY